MQTIPTPSQPKLSTAPVSGSAPAPAAQGTLLERVIANYWMVATVAMILIGMSGHFVGVAAILLFVVGPMLIRLSGRSVACGKGRRPRGGQQGQQGQQGPQDAPLR